MLSWPWNEKVYSTLKDAGTDEGTDKFCASTRDNVIRWQWLRCSRIGRIKPGCAETSGKLAPGIKGAASWEQELSPVLVITRLVVKMCRCQETNSFGGRYVAQ
jgi:hypothetical protein